MTPSTTSPRGVRLDQDLLRVLPAEVRLVMATAGGRELDEDLRRLASLPLDWTVVQMIGEAERAFPVLWTRLQEAGAVLPPEVAQAFSRLSMVTAFRLQQAEDRVLQLLAALEHAGIDGILLKGAGLALTVYDGFQARPMGDADLLVAPDLARRAWDFAIELGWYWDSRSYPFQGYGVHHHLPPLLDRDPNGVRLEVHTALNMAQQPLSLDFSQAMSESATFSRKERTGHVLSRELNVVHLAVHFAWSHQAQFGLWRMVRDLGALERAGVDWDRVAELAEHHGARLPTYWGLELGRRLGGMAGVPDRVMQRLAPRRGALARGVALRHLAMHAVGDRKPCPSAGLRRWMWTMALTDRMSPVFPKPWEIEAEPGPGQSLPRRVLSQVGDLGRWLGYARLLRG